MARRRAGAAFSGGAALATAVRFGRFGARTEIQPLSRLHRPRAGDPIASPGGRVSV